MKLLFRIILGASLATNLVLAWLAGYVGISPRLGMGALAPRVMTVLGAETGSIRSEPAANPDLAVAKNVAAFLHERRYPDWVIRRATGAAIMEYYGLERWEAARKLKLPGAKAMLEEINRHYTEEINALIGPLPGRAEAEATGEFSAEAQRRLQFGDLAPEKVDAVQKVEAEHQGRLRLPDDQLAASLSAILTPKELDDYMRYRSNLAEKVQGRLRAVNIDEETYLTLLEAEKVLSPRPKINGAEAPLPISMLQTYRERLGDDRFLVVMGRLDEVAGSADIGFQNAGLAPGKRVELFFQAAAVLREIDGASPEARGAMAAAAYSAITRGAGLNSPSQATPFDRSLLGNRLKQLAAGIAQP